jgi:hypothetical protein
MQHPQDGPAASWLRLHDASEGTGFLRRVEETAQIRVAVPHQQPGESRLKGKRHKVKGLWASKAQSVAVLAKLSIALPHSYSPQPSPIATFNEARLQSRAAATQQM